MMLARNRLLRVGTYAVLLLWALFTLFPIFWTFVTSVKSPRAVNSPTPTFLPWVDFEPTLKTFLFLIVLLRAFYAFQSRSTFSIVTAPAPGAARDLLSFDASGAGISAS